MLKAGATEVCITPPIGVELAGYGPRLRRYSTDIHDHLMAQALVLDDGHDRVVLITSDWIAIAPEVVGWIRQGVHRQTGIPPGHVMVSCAHIHTAPTAAQFRDWGTPDRSHVRMVVRHMIGAVVASIHKLQPARLSVERGEHHDLAWNRIGRDEVDPTVEVMRIDAVSGEPLALLVHYACHPVVLGLKTAISADYPGALRCYLHRQYPGVILFANGACGDIDPATNRTVWGSGTFDDLERIGAALGKDAWNAARAAMPLDETRLRVRHGTMRLAYNVPSLERLRERITYCERLARAQGRGQEGFESVAEVGDIEQSMPRFWLRYYRALEKRIRAGKQPDHDDAELQTFIFGESLALLAIPAEVFTVHGQAIRNASAYPHTLPICYANGIYGYIPPRFDFEQGGYAATLAAAVYDRAPFRPDVGESLLDAAAQLLQ